MGENMELQQLVEDEQEDELKIQEPKAFCGCPYLGLILATLSSLFFSLCSVIVKWMTDIDPMALAAYRYLGVLLPAIPIVIYRQEKVFPKGKRIMLLLRSFTGTAALMLSFYAFRHMPLADASVIVFSVPVFTGIFARMFLKEPCGLFNVFSVILTLIGVVFITRPPSLFGNTVDSLGDNGESPEIWGCRCSILSDFIRGKRLRSAQSTEGHTFLCNHDKFRCLCFSTVHCSYVFNRGIVPAILRYGSISDSSFSYI
ncbi:hypothetical protein NQ317_001741 [Molorchus minor]|uniref:EamA domain-containing protein n=1 Tax=Molorchus minor TaxID=1323400 RepID=A0ABQ9JW23_9CUCU|nr:hypothetical protein NQ317_001741 [Molorchus minor]